MYFKYLLLYLFVQLCVYQVLGQCFQPKCTHITQGFPSMNILSRSQVRFWASLLAQLVKNPPAKWETWVRSLGWEDPLEKGKATHSRILTWRIPPTVESMGSQRVRHD